MTYIITGIFILVIIVGSVWIRELKLYYHLSETRSATKTTIKRHSDNANKLAWLLLGLVILMLTLSWNA